MALPGPGKTVDILAEGTGTADYCAAAADIAHTGLAVWLLGCGLVPEHSVSAPAHTVILAGAACSHTAGAAPGFGSVWLWHLQLAVAVTLHSVPASA